LQDSAEENQPAVRRLIGMVRSPRATLAAAICRPRSFDLAVLIVAVSTFCSMMFLITPIGRLAALDQEVRQLESMGLAVTDQLYAQLRSWQRYRPLLSAIGILAGWPMLCACLVLLIRWIARATRNGAMEIHPTFAQVFSVIVHASSVLALRSLAALPINFARESLGGATSLATILPGIGDATFAARLAGAVDVFVVWWMLLLALGLRMLYHIRAITVARWLFGAYATGAAALALTQALRGGV